MNGTQLSSAPDMTSRPARLGGGGAKKNYYTEKFTSDGRA